MRIRKPAAATLIALSALALGACDLRREDDGNSADGKAGPVAASSATPATAPTNSIIRDDIAPPEPMKLPSQPFDVTIPMPEGTDINESAERQLASAMESDAMDEADWPIVLSGHTDSSGNDQANLRASRARAEAVAAWLVERGVDDDRIEVIAFGEQNPVAPNALPDGSPNEEGRRTNRRVVIRIAPPTSSGTGGTDEGKAKTGGKAGEPRSRPLARTND
ncbi:OmpA family protein [Aurantiacibacter spongiae]|nr:OmpA family protein [Aurantiacibacter spongiae]